MQVDAAVAEENPGRTSLDLPITAGFPNIQDGAAEQPVDWENFINLDGENEQQQQQQEGEQLQDQEGQQGPDNGKAGAPGEKQRRKRKRDAHQQELNKQAQHRYRCLSLSLLCSKAACAACMRCRVAMLRPWTFCLSA